jgi:hypothetical protein
LITLLAVAAVLAGIHPCRAADRREFAWRLNFWNETGATEANRRSPFNPENLWLDLPTWSNSLVTEGEASCSFGSRFKAAGSFVNRFDYAREGSDRLRMKELYVRWSVNAHWDVTAGKRILRWGTGYAWSPSGVLDPQRDPRDPNDRLSQYEGRELVELRGTYGSHSFTGVYTAPRLFSRLQAPRREDQWAFKYNGLVRGLDYSLIAGFGGAERANRYGANATYVIGQALEVHGDFVARRGASRLYPLAIAEFDPRVTYPVPPYGALKEHDEKIHYRALAGANYTFPAGWNLVVEYYRDDEGLSPIERQRLDAYVFYNEEQQRLLGGSDPSRITLAGANLLWTLQGIGGFNRSRDYLFARASRGSIARKWDLEQIAIVSLRDGSSIWIPQISYEFTGRLSGYVRCTRYAGSRDSEFGSLPWKTNVILGVALRF